MKQILPRIVKVKAKVVLFLIILCFFTIAANASSKNTKGIDYSNFSIGISGVLNSEIYENEEDCDDEDGNDDCDDEDDCDEEDGNDDCDDEDDCDEEDGNDDCDDEDDCDEEDGNDDCDDEDDCDEEDGNDDCDDEHDCDEEDEEDSQGCNVDIPPPTPPVDIPPPTPPVDIPPPTPPVASVDLGDAPVSYSEASHIIVNVANPYLGTTAPDADSAPQYSTDALADDTGLTRVDDEGGTIMISSPLGSNDLCGFVMFSDANPNIQVISNGSGYINGWIDWNKDGIFTANEQFLTDVVSGTGVNNAQIIIPTNFMFGLTFMRVRISSVPGLTSFGSAVDGEVEDCTFDIL